MAFKCAPAGTTPKIAIKGEGVSEQCNTVVQSVKDGFPKWSQFRAAYGTYGIGQQCPDISLFKEPFSYLASVTRFCKSSDK